MSVHPMYVSYTSIPTGSASSTQINPKKDSNNQFGVVLTSINNSNKSNTNSLSSTYIKTHSGNMLPSSLNNLVSKNPSSSLNHHQYHHHYNHQQSPSHYQLSEHRQLSSSSNLSQYNSRNNLLSKSASTQQIIRRNPSFTSGSNHRSDIRYTEITPNATNADELTHDKDGDTFSNRSYFIPTSSQASTAAASPITSNKLMAVNWQQQQLISRNFGIQQNPLNHLVDNDADNVMTTNNNSPSMSVRSYSPSGTPKNLKAFPISSPDKLAYACVTRSPNLNHMPRRRPLPPIPQQVETSYQSPPPLPPHLHSPSSFCDQIRDKPSGQPRINLNQFIPEYNSPSPLPAIPPHMLQHPMYRVRSQDRISNRLKRQSGAHLPGAYQHEHQRPRSFCNNMINYQDYKDMQ